MKILIIIWATLIGPLLSNTMTFEKKPMDTGFIAGEKEAVYIVERMKAASMQIDGAWDKPEWRDIKSVSIQQLMGSKPDFQPQTEAKLMYDDKNIFGIFRVKDRFVKSLVTEYNGNVSGDSCVEFFFSPDSDVPEKYFNLEINAGGTPLIFYVSKPWDEFVKLEAEDIEQIEIAHSMPAVVDPEIAEETTWTIEYRIPIAMLRKFSNVTPPQAGTVWKANFYKTGSRTSNPHYFTWNFVDHPKPNFHLPQFFGTLQFK